MGRFEGMPSYPVSENKPAEGEQESRRSGFLSKLSDIPFIKPLVLAGMISSLSPDTSKATTPDLQETIKNSFNCKDSRGGGRTECLVKHGLEKDPEVMRVLETAKGEGIEVFHKMCKGEKCVNSLVEINLNEEGNGIIMSNGLPFDTLRIDGKQFVSFDGKHMIPYKEETTNTSSMVVFALADGRNFLVDKESDGTILSARELK